MSRRPARFAFVAVALTLGLVGGPQAVKADGVGDAQQQLQQAQDELDNLINQMGQLDEDYGAAQDQKVAVDADIAESQTKVDEITAKLGDVQQVLTDLAVTKFTTGGSAALSPLFSNAATYSAAEQRDALGNVALDTGEATADDLQSLVDQLAKEQAKLQAKQQKAASLIATLEQKQKDFESLQAAYEQKLAQAQANFGAAQLEAEAERRAVAAAAVSAPSNNGGGNDTPTGSTVAPGRGGGGDTGTGNDGGTGGTGGGTPSTDPKPNPKPAPPPVSGKAGVAVAAAYSQIGVPYKFAAESPGVAFDCSGLTKWAWGRAGVYLPHQSGAQYASTPHVSRDQVQPGDLIFYYAPIGHVGIYVGGGQMIHAVNTGTTVALAPVRWNKVVGIGRPG